MSFLERKDYFLPIARRALSGRFANEGEFLAFFERIADDTDKESFLRVASYYLFLVKAGDWVIDDPASNPVIEQFTNSYKLITLISLIESLGDAGGHYVDFYEFLIARRGGVEFPILRELLDRRYREYKNTYGSWRRCVTFFQRLDQAEKDRLCAAFGGRFSFDEVVRYLYDLRSKFVHEGRVVLHLNAMPALLLGDEENRAVLVRLSMADVLRVFETGVLLRFR